MKAKMKLKICFFTIFLILLPSLLMYHNVEAKVGCEFDVKLKFLVNNQMAPQGIKSSQIEIFHDDINSNYWNLINVSKSYFETSDQQDYFLENSTGDGFWNYTGNSYYLGDQDIFPEGIYWDGTYWWMIGSNSDNVHKYYSNWTFTGDSYDITGQFTTPTDIFWDGTNWWGLGDGTADRVYQYDSNWVYTGTSYHIGGQEPAAKGIFWDGTNWWLVGLNNRVIYQYSSSWIYTGISQYIGGQDSYPSDLFWDGKNWWVPGITNDRVYRYNSNWSYTGSSYDLGGVDEYPTDVVKEGGNWWMLGYENSRVFQYSSEPFNISKNYFGNGYMYMQTNTTETIGLKSINYGSHYNLNSKNYFNVEFETNSDSQIDLILLKDGIINESLILSQSGNSNFSKRSVQIIVDKDIEFDQIIVSATLEDTDYVKIYDIKAEKDTTPPSIFINSPNIGSIFGEDPPVYNITVVEANLDTIWYRLDNETFITENFTTVNTNGFIEEFLWDSLGNGTITIQFFANDTLGFVGSSEITVRKDVLTPKISIVSPLPHYYYGNEPPNVTISVSGINLDATWYTFDYGATNYTFTGLTGVIDQAAWNAVPEGEVILTFFLNNSLGLEAHSDVILLKDTIKPIITIISPLQNGLFGVSAPNFNVEIKDANDIHIMWYSIDNGMTNYTFTSNGSINQLAWNFVNNTIVSIKFYAKDLIGNIVLEEISVRKDVLAPQIIINTPSFKDTRGKRAPRYDLEISDNNLDTVWYSVGRGATKHLITDMIGYIDQSEWDNLPEGIVKIRFSANDSTGNTYFKDIVIYKDLSGVEREILLNNITGVVLICIGILLATLSAYKANSIYKTKKARPKVKPLQKEALLDKQNRKKQEIKPIEVSTIKKEVPLFVDDSQRGLIKEIFCPHCGTPNLSSGAFCHSCGKSNKPLKISMKPSVSIGGFILSLIGGLSSIALGFFLPTSYASITDRMPNLIMILQFGMFWGGIVSIIGALIVLINPKIGGSVGLVGAILAGGNIPSIVGAVLIFKKLRN